MNSEAFEGNCFQSVSLDPPPSIAIAERDVPATPLARKCRRATAITRSRDGFCRRPSAVRLHVAEPTLRMDHRKIRCAADTSKATIATIAIIQKYSTPASMKIGRAHV